MDTACDGRLVMVWRFSSYVPILNAPVPCEVRWIEGSIAPSGGEGRAMRPAMMSRTRAGGG